MIITSKLQLYTFDMSSTRLNVIGDPIWGNADIGMGSFRGDIEYANSIW